MKTFRTITLLAALQIIPAFLFAQSGADLFKQNCGACHSVGAGKLVGPDLKGVGSRHPAAWLMKWIKSSQSLVNAKDKDAVKLFTENSMIPMPDQPLKDDQIKAILAYIAEGGGVMSVDNNAAPENTPAVADKTATDPSALNNNGVDPLVLSGTPAVFKATGNTTTEAESTDTFEPSGNAWLVYLSIASMVVLIATIAVFGGVVKDTPA